MPAEIQAWRDGGSGCCRTCVHLSVVEMNISQADDLEKILNFCCRRGDVVHPGTSQCFGGTDREINKENSLLTSH